MKAADDGLAGVPQVAGKVICPDVLIAAIRDGLNLLTWQSDTFAYADAWDEKAKRYTGLQSGTSVRVLADGQSLVVKPDIARVQMEAEKAAQPKAGGVPPKSGIPVPTPPAGGSGAGGVPSGGGSQLPKPVYRRFHGSVRLDSLRIGRHASRIADEVIQHLAKLVGAEVDVTLEIQTRLSEGAADKTVRDVTENCRTLKFDSFGFEEE